MMKNEERELLLLVAERILDFRPGDERLRSAIRRVEEQVANSLPEMLNLTKGIQIDD